MKSWILGKMRNVCLGVAALTAAGVICASANAAVVQGVSVTKGAGWVRVSVNAPGGSYRVHELPVGTSAYRSIAIDVPNSSIVGGLEPKNRVPVNEGLVAQVRVKQMRGFVRIYVDVVSFPKYQTGHEGGHFVLGMDAYHMRNGNPIAPQLR
ncbi:AMIN domain-containing protein [bacterium]|nr:AMIN domain-containing protein [bacterium]